MVEPEDYDVVDYWSEVKLDIVKDYLAEYSKIMNAQTNPSFSYAYIDGFSGPGVCIRKATGDYIPGSPLNALNVVPPFHEYYFIDMDGDKAARLRKYCEGMGNVVVKQGDCNKILLEEIFPTLKFEDYRRGIVLLDPYRVNLRWEVVEEAGKLGTLELFLNFSTMDINRNVLRKDPTKTTDSSIERMTAFWGDESWRKEFYREKDEPLPIFEVEEEREATNLQVVNAYRGRLKSIAGFKYVSEGMPMVNRQNSVIYYLLFATQNATGNVIVEYIFDKYKDRGAP